MAELAKRGSDNWELTGPLRLADAVALSWDRCGNQFSGGDELRIDLSGLTEYDSAALAVLLDWQRGMRRQGRTLTLSSTPEGMQAIAELCGVTPLLPRTL